MEKPPDINALIQLLDDPDPEIYNHVKGELEKFGGDVIPALESAWETSDLGITFQDRVEQLIHTIQFEGVIDGLRQWCGSEEKDLLDGMILIARYQFPELNEQKVYDELDSIEQEIWIELNNNLTALEQVRIINHVLYDIYGFTGNTSNYHSPQNSYINTVLETKKGNPLSLSIVYSIIGQRLHLPIHGVNLPKHFILAYSDHTILRQLNLTDDEVLFYINPFSKGGVFSKREIYKFIEQLDLKPDPAYFLPCSNIEIMNRVLSNLLFSYSQLEAHEKVREIQTLMKTLSLQKED